MELLCAITRQPSESRFDVTNYRWKLGLWRKTVVERNQRITFGFSQCHHFPIDSLSISINQCASMQPDDDGTYFVTLRSIDISQNLEPVDFAVEDCALQQHGLCQRKLRIHDGERRKQ